MEIFPPHVRQRGMIGVMSAAVIAMLGFALVAPFAVAGWSSPLPTPLPPVYYPSSLEVVQPMGSREGLVETTAVHQQDGDFTFDLLSIPINEVLHVEITCVFPPQSDAARVGMRGLHQSRQNPARGRIRPRHRSACSRSRPQSGIPHAGNPSRGNRDGSDTSRSRSYTKATPQIGRSWSGSFRFLGRAAMKSEGVR